MTERLTPEGLEALRRLTPLWRLQGQGLSMRRVFRFNHFDQAFEFMTQVAQWAKRQDHHPLWIHDYDTVEVVLSTHEVGALSIKDQHLAMAMDQVFISLSAPHSTGMG
jgi:4a-hydroxytetrahydrobiopterin dehydratase